MILFFFCYVVTSQPIFSCLYRAGKLFSYYKATDIYQPGKGYTAISESVGLQWTTVRNIIHTRKKPGTVDHQEWPAWKHFSKSFDGSSRRSHKNPE